MRHRKSFPGRMLILAAGLVGLAIVCLPGLLGEAQQIPGLPSGKSRRAPGLDAATAITPLVTETGNISLSIDGLGTLSPSGTVEVQKPAGTTVRRAFLAAASRGESNRVLQNGDVKINGADVIFTQSTPSAIQSSNHFGEVTAIVKPIVDAAPAGLVTLTITELGSVDIDGEVLAVIFDDPAQTLSNTAIILFGAQNTTGDNFNVLLAQPISDPTRLIDFSLGISWGNQVLQGRPQFSVVDVNGSRLTSSAGGQDDTLGAVDNGSLLTVGGVGDSRANPPPFDPPGDNFRLDDELYDLRPFVGVGTTSVNVFTQNPSNDDNIFFAAFFFGGATATIGEIVLAPASATNPINTPHTVTATLQAGGNPIVGRNVNFQVTAGPNAGVMGNVTSNASGQASFTYTSAVTGTDQIIASFVNNQGQTVTSNTVTKTWVPAGSCTLTCPNNITVASAPGQCAANINYPPPTQGGVCGTVTCSPPSGSLFPIGTTTVTCTATAGGGSCAFTVTVTGGGSGPLTITCPPNLKVLTPGVGTPSVVINYPPPTVGGSCGGPGGVSVVCMPPSGSVFPAGTTTVTCTATSGGSTVSCTFTVSAFDVLLQDDSNQNIELLFSSFTGDYCFCCPALPFGQSPLRGRGTVRVSGAAITLNHNVVTLPLRVRASVSPGARRGEGALQNTLGQTICVIQDRDITDNLPILCGNPPAQ